MFGYRTLYFAGLTALLISDQIMGQEHAFSLPFCIAEAALGTAALLSHKRHQSILPPLYIVLSIIGYACWWLGDLGGQQVNGNRGRFSTSMASAVPVSWSHSICCKCTSYTCIAPVVCTGV